nr:MAG TPA: hypothetical protein [Caudoviricetes sp.]
MIVPDGQVLNDKYHFQTPPPIIFLNMLIFLNNPLIN